MRGRARSAVGKDKEREKGGKGEGQKKKEESVNRGNGESENKTALGAPGFEFHRQLSVEKTAPRITGLIGLISDFLFLPFTPSPLPFFFPRFPDSFPSCSSLDLGLEIEQIVSEHLKHLIERFSTEE
jgi:hypothetical protein